MPAERREDRNQGVMKRSLRVVAAYEDIEDKRNIDRKRASLKRELELVLVVNVLVEVNRPRWNCDNPIRRPSIGILPDQKSRQCKPRQQWDQKSQISPG